MPSFINELSLRDLQTHVKSSGSLIIVDPSKLNSGDTLKLRKSLTEAGAKMKVAKVSLIRRAVPESAAKMVDGKSAIALVSAKDMLAAAKVLADLEKEDKLAVRGGFMDGQLLNAAEVKKLATMPSQLTLRGMLVNVLAAPLVGLARVIAEISKKKEGAGG
jgi:large subunit ribosomal protein L10